MSDYMKEAERLLSEYGDAVSDAVVFAQDPSGYSMRMEEATRAALLAHIQRGAVPEGWQVVPKKPTPEMLAGGWGYWLNVMAPGKQRDTAAKEYAGMLAAAPTPDQFRDAAKMMAVPAEVPMPEDDMSDALGELAGVDTHDVNLRDNPESYEILGRLLHTYGDAREAAGYARGLRDAVRDANPLVQNGEVLVTVTGLTGSGKSAIAGEIEIMCQALGLEVEWGEGAAEKHLTHADWTESLEMYRPRVRIVEANIPRTDAALRGEVK